jgi:hypothetical protein
MTLTRVIGNLTSRSPRRFRTESCPLITSLTSTQAVALGDRVLDVRPGREHHFHRVPGEDLQLSQARLVVGISAGDQQHAVIDPDRQQRVSACVVLVDQGECLDLARGVIQIDGVGRRPAACDERLDGGTDGRRIPNHSNIIRKSASPW